MEYEVENKNDLIDELKRSQRFLKEKIEVILDKLESIDAFDVDEQVDNSKTIVDDDEVREPIRKSKIIQDENVVDLKKIDEHKEIEKNDLSSETESSDKVTDFSEKDTLVVNDEESSIEHPIDETIEDTTSAHDDNIIDKENTSSSEDLESDDELKVIDGGKNLSEKKSDSNILKNENKENENSTYNNDKNEGFLFNTGSVNENMKNKGNWLKNNPFI